MTYGGFVILMCGAAVDWMARLIRIVCHSSAEAEIDSGCKAGKRGQFIRLFLNELKELGAGKGVDGPFIYLIDNSACGPLTKNIGVSKKTEHFLRDQYYLRWLVYHRLALVIWIPTDFQTGDIMTKVLKAEAFYRHQRTMLNHNKLAKEDHGPAQSGS